MEDGMTKRRASDRSVDRLGPGGPWVPVPLWLIGRVSDGALVTWLAIAAHVNARSATAWPRVDTLARERGATARSVQRHLRELEAAGCITVTATRRPDGSQGSNTYRLASSPPVDDPVHEGVDNAEGGDNAGTGGATNLAPHELDLDELHEATFRGSGDSLPMSPADPVEDR